MAASVIGALRVDLGLDSAQFSKGLRGAKKNLTATAKQMRNVGAVMSAAITAPLVVAGRDMVRLAAEQGAALKLVEQGVIATGNAAGLSVDQLADMAAGLQDLSQIGDEDILRNVTAQMQTFTKVTGDEFARAQQAVLDISTVMGTDLKSTALQVGKALNDPKAGLTALSRSGIQFSKDQKEVIAALVETGDIAEAQGIILDELANQFGGQAAAAATTFQGEVNQLSNSWGDLKEQFGFILMEALPPLIDGLRDLIKWVSDLDPKTKEMGVRFGLVAAAVGPVVAIMGALALGVAAVGVPVALAAAAIATLTTAVIAFWPEMVAAKDATVAFVKGAWDEVKRFAKDLGGALKAVIPMMKQLGMDMLEGLKAGLFAKYTEVKDSITGFAGSLVDGVKDRLGIQSPSRVFREIGANIVEGLGDGISAAAPQVTGLMKTITDGLTQDVSGMFKSVLLEGANFRTALSGILGGAADRLLDRGVSSLLGGIPGFASGTSFAPGGLALVGERGAELVNLPRGSQVIPNDQLRGLASGSAEVHVTVGVDPASGNLTAFVDRRAGMAVAQGAPVIMSAQDRRTAQNLETYTARRG